MVIDDVISPAWSEHCGKPVRLEQLASCLLGEMRPFGALERHLDESRSDLRGPEFVEVDLDEVMVLACMHDLRFSMNASQQVRGLGW